MTGCTNWSPLISECETFIAASASFDRFLKKADGAKKSTDSEDDVAPKSIIFQAGTPVDRTQSLEDLRIFVENLDKSSTSRKKIRKMKWRRQGTCLGMITQKQAEKEVRGRGQFVTYYRIPDAFHPQMGIPIDCSVTLQLVICYLDTRHCYSHYPINKITSPSAQIFYQLGFSDGQKCANEPIFFTIKNLIKHYTQFGYVDSFTSAGGIRVEIFPK
ncbi:unnamed protein product [Caenorhabditis sp. 36 PRJEB53466]|nr:unnamed protein product [Caenorhabditis sp. 36 PRJEB53466]